MGRWLRPCVHAPRRHLGHQRAVEGLGFAPLLPGDFPEPAAQPLIQDHEGVWYCSEPKIADPAAGKGVNAGLIKHTPCGWRTSRARARSSRVGHTCSPVPVHRPARHVWMRLPPDSSSWQAPLALSSPSAPRIPGTRTFTSLALCHAYHTRPALSGARLVARPLQRPASWPWHFGQGVAW
jgi:hypothetical protein